MQGMDSALRQKMRGVAHAIKSRPEGEEPTQMSKAGEGEKRQTKTKGENAIECT